MTNVELIVNDMIYSGWHSIDITRSLENFAGQFELGITITPHARPIILQPGSACQLDVNGQRVITGFIDTVTTAIDAENHTITVTGRDKTSDLVDCAIIHKTGQWRNATLQTVAQDLCKPFNITTVWQVATSTIKQWQIEPGETVFENLARAARQYGVLVTSNASGDLVFTTAGSQVVDTVLLSKTHENGTLIKSIESTLSWVDRYSLYRVQGDNAAGGLWGETQTTEQTSGLKTDVIDTSITRYRPTIVLADDNLTKKSAQIRGEWERRRAAAYGTQITVEVQGWLTSTGQLWQPNTLVKVTAPAIGVNEDSLIVSVNYLLSNHTGTITRLSLMDREGFTEPAQTPTKKQNQGIWQ